MSSKHAAFLLVVAASLAACGGGGGGTGDENKPPGAQISVTPATGAAPLAVVASGESSTDPDGTIAAYAWKFGDGAEATGVRVEHTFAAAGEYTVELTVTDDQGKKSTATGSVVATGDVAVYNGSTFDSAAYQDEPASGTLDATVLQ